MDCVSCVCLHQRVLSKDGNLLSKTSSGMQSGGEEEQDEEAHTPLPPPMEIIKDPSAQDDKVRGGRRERERERERGRPSLLVSPDIVFY